MSFWTMEKEGDWILDYKSETGPVIGDWGSMAHIRQVNICQATGKQWGTESS